MPLDTLPSLMTVASVGRRQRSIRATVLFHPNIERIGAYLDIVSWSDQEVCPKFDVMIGRLTPEFSDGLPLDEPHVSRAAVRVFSESGGLSVATGSEGAFCRIGAHELDQCQVSPELLTEGFPVRLGHGVVLFLREVVIPVTAPEVGVDAYPGCSVESQVVRQLTAAAAGSDLPVLLLGKTGVGKEWIAQAIHSHSSRAARPMVSVNIAGVPETVAAAELFGAEKGAFTGADKRAGHFRDAHTGTLFLDEIGDTPLQVQAQLLRVLQEQEVQVLGGKRVPVDVRIIAATDAAVDDEDSFRAALKHRLAGITIKVEPLGSRREDIGSQVVRMLDEAGVDHPVAPLARLLEDKGIAARWARIFFDLALHSWPGNSRELDLRVKRTLLEGDDAWEYAVGGEPARSGREISDDELAATYADCGYEPAAAAIVLGLSRGALYRRIKAHPDCRIANEVSDSELDAAIKVCGFDLKRLSEHLRVSGRGLRSRVNLRRKSAE